MTIQRDEAQLNIGKPGGKRGMGFELVLIAPLVRSYLQFCTPGRPFVCVKETLLEGAERDQCCNFGPRARQGLLHKAEPHHIAPSLSLSVSLCVALPFSLLVSYQKTINGNYHIELSH